MKIRFMTLAATIISFVLVGAGQTAMDMGKLASPTTVYVRNGVSIIPEFDRHGQICKAVLQPSRYSNGTIYIGKILLKGEQIREILDVLAPAGIRGEKTHFWNLLVLSGQSYNISYNYEYIHVTLSGGISSSIAIPASKQREPLEQMTDPGKAGDITSCEVATISWTKRECDKN